VTASILKIFHDLDAVFLDFFVIFDLHDILDFCKFIVSNKKMERLFHA